MLASNGEAPIGLDIAYFFYPELLSGMALRDLKASLDKMHESGYTGRAIVLCFFCSRWALEELKNHQMFKSMHFYTLSLNDKFLEHKMLHVMEDLNPNQAER